MEIDKRKKYLMVLDVETTNNDMTQNVYNDGLVYDIRVHSNRQKG